MTVNRLTVLALAALLVIAGAACGSSQHRPEGQVDATSTPEPRQVRVSAGASLAFGDLRALTWASNWIVRGRVVEVQPSQRFSAEMGPLGAQTPQEFLDAWIYTDYVVAVEQVFRGTPQEKVVVRQKGGTIGSVTVESPEYPELRIGDEWIFFLIPPSWDQPGDALWATGVTQGYWRVVGDQVVPMVNIFPTLTRAEFAQAVADALRKGQPSESETLRVVPLEEAPAGPDLPSISATQAS